MAAYIGQIIGSADGQSRLVFKDLIDNFNLDLLDAIDLKFQLHAENKDQDKELQQELSAKGLLGADNYLHGQAEAVDADLEVKLTPALNDVLVFSQSNRFTVNALLPDGRQIPQHFVSTVNLALSPLHSAAGTAPGTAAAGAAASAPGNEASAPAAGAAAFGAAPNAGAADNPFAAGAAQSAAPAQTSAQSKSRLPLFIGLGVLLLALLLAALWFFLLRGGDESAVSAPAEPPAAEQTAAPEAAPEPEPQPEAAAEPVSSPEAAPAAAAQAGSAAGASSGSSAGACEFDPARSDADAISGCMALNDDAALLQLALTAADNQRCDLAKRILQAKGRSAGGEFALKLAEFFDPNTPENPCFVKSADDAAYWQGKAGAQVQGGAQ